MRNISCRLAFLGLLAASAAACSPASGPEDGQVAAADDSAIRSLVPCPSGASAGPCPAGDFLLTCADGTSEVVSVGELESGAVCPPGAPLPDGGQGDVATPTCVPTTCSAAGATCGSIPDTCGGTLACGTCSAPATCGGGGTRNTCGAPDPFDPASCAGALSSAASSSVVLGALQYERSRYCEVGTNICNDWGAAKASQFDGGDIGISVTTGNTMVTFSEESLDPNVGNFWSSMTCAVTAVSMDCASSSDNVLASIPGASSITGSGTYACVQMIALMRTRDETMAAVGTSYFGNVDLETQYAVLAEAP